MSNFHNSSLYSLPRNTTHTRMTGGRDRLAGTGNKGSPTKVVSRRDVFTVVCNFECPIGFKPKQ